MKLYTRGGDKGKTSLLSGERVSKRDPRVDTYGDIDELNSFVGAVVAFLPVPEPELIDELHQIQSDLLRLGAQLATSPDPTAMSVLDRVRADDVRRLEVAIDRMDAQLPKLGRFLLPGGHPAAAMAHVSRTICRRAERRVTGLLDHAGGDPVGSTTEVLAYVNRLSDYLFILARYCNHLAGVEDVRWERRSSEP